MSTPFTFGIVGAGWRAEFFVRLARLLSDQLTLVGASVRRSEAAEQLTRRWGVPAFLSPTELVHSRRPDFVISCVPSAANPKVVTALVESGVHVLSETPPAPDLDGLRKLWALVGSPGLVPITTRSLLVTRHGERWALVARAVIQPPSTEPLRSTNKYPPLSVVRGELGMNPAPVLLCALPFPGSILGPVHRAPWTTLPTTRGPPTPPSTSAYRRASRLSPLTNGPSRCPPRLPPIVVATDHALTIGVLVLPLTERP